MLRRDTRGRFVKKTAFLSPTRYYFVSGQFRTIHGLKEDAFQQLLKLQESTPVVVMRSSEDCKTWQMFGGEFYWENEGYTDYEVKALVLERLKKKKRKIQRAISLMELEESALTGKRERIPEDVKTYVWRRDGGKCVKCGSKENLEFDHIIPLSMGGSNTVRNIQILCEKCNRAKGGSLV